MLSLLLQIYLLADTSYNSLAVDEVAAAHINADAMVCLYYIFSKLTLVVALPCTL